jgi:hypothetical protein
MMTPNYADSFKVTAILQLVFVSLKYRCVYSYNIVVGTEWENRVID